MTLAEAHEVGRLAAALGDVESAIAAVSKSHDALIGIGMSVDHSEAGCSSLGPEVLIPREMALASMGDLRSQIMARLNELGVRL